MRTVSTMSAYLQHEVRWWELWPRWYHWLNCRHVKTTCCCLCRCCGPGTDQKSLILCQHTESRHKVHVNDSMTDRRAQRCSSIGTLYRPYTISPYARIHQHPRGTRHKATKTNPVTAGARVCRAVRRAHGLWRAVTTQLPQPGVP